MSTLHLNPNSHMITQRNFSFVCSHLDPYLMIYIMETFVFMELNKESFDMLGSNIAYLLYFY
jgi:hypothetical protein